MKKTREDLHIHSENIVNSVLDNDFGGYGKDHKKSFALQWDKVNHAKSYAIYMIDYDAIHVVGFPFIHWVVANIKDNKLVLDATHLDKTIIQGQNSRTKVGWLNTKGENVSEDELMLNANYTGPYPPDKSHEYTLFVFALDVESLPLKNGFFLDEMIHHMKDHIISYDQLDFIYNKK